LWQLWQLWQLRGLPMKQGFTAAKGITKSWRFDSTKVLVV
jgi:hypothetical protein